MELRLILLLIGVIVIGVVYYTSRPEAESREEDAEDLAAAANRADPEAPIDATILDDLEGDVFMAPDGPSASVIEEIEVERKRKEPSLGPAATGTDVIAELEEAQTTLAADESAAVPSVEAKPEQSAVIETAHKKEPTIGKVTEPDTTDAGNEYDDEPLFPELDDNELGALAEPVHFKHSIDRAPRRSKSSVDEPQDSEPEVEVFTSQPSDDQVEEKVVKLTPVRAAEPKQEQSPEPDEKVEEAPTESDASATNDVHVVMMYVSAKQPEGMAGSTIAAVMKKHELTMNDKGLFQKLDTEEQRISFQVANMFAPGTFDQQSIEEQYFKGVAVFGVLPGPQVGYDLMDDILFLARDLEQQLDAQLLDEARSVFSPQTEQYMREQIVQFEHQQRLAST